MSIYVPAELDLYISKGEVYSKQITIRDVNYNPVDISLFTNISCKVTRYIGNGIEFVMTGTIVTPTVGLIQVDMTDTETDKMIFDRYWFTITLSNNLETAVVVEGQILMLTF